MNDATLLFARQHVGDDVRLLALRGCKDPDVDLTLALQQIQGLQTARRKLPAWAAADGVLFPPHLNMEQCSSEATARYKLHLARRLAAFGAGDGSAFGADDGSAFGAGDGSAVAPSSPRRLVDLTGGFGVDFTVMAQAFDEGLCIERDEALCALARHNFPLVTAAFGFPPCRASFDCADAAATLDTLDHATLIYADPARRDSHGQRTYAIADCTPDVLLLRDSLLDKADHVVLKLSPMLDWRKAVADLGPQYVDEVHLVEVGAECKELLVVMHRQAAPLRLYCYADGLLWTTQPPAFGVGDGSAVAPSEGGSATASSEDGSAVVSPGAYLYEPGAAAMKAGCFAALAADFGLRQLAPNSHLFLSDVPRDAFPGRRFRVQAVTTMNRRQLADMLRDIRRANITTRNFPLTAPQLRQRLHLADGGDTYLFATTLHDATHVIIVCHKA